MNRSRPSQAPWGRQRSALIVSLTVTTLATLAVVASVEHVTGTALVGLRATVAALVAAAISCLLWRHIEQHDTDTLNRSLEDAVATTRLEHARMHEIKASLAGITSATQLIHDRPAGITEERRGLLEDMVQAELARLGRLLNDSPTVPRPRTADLDQTIERLALAQEARGNVVRWHRSGQQVAAEPDAVAEVINILLDNAAKHGSSGAEVAVSTGRDTVEISVSDSGPGVSPAVRDRLFTWGARGPRSSGNGIGLHIAHDLTRRQGGYLELREGTSGRGTTFVVGLRPAVGSGEAHGAVARLA
jgi:signal transduction histidine kinase